jgi:hypothetical protein
MSKLSADSSKPPSSFTSTTATTRKKGPTTAGSESSFTAPSMRRPVGTITSVGTRTAVTCSQCHSCGSNCPCVQARSKLSKLERQVQVEQAEQMRTQKELAKASREIQLLREIIQRKLGSEANGSVVTASTAKQNTTVEPSATPAAVGVTVRPPRSHVSRTSASSSVSSTITASSVSRSQKR